jgi:predicted TIM-barrel fold metal-dependent hydrolase
VADRLDWELPATPAALSDRWVEELDRHQVGRATLIASIPGDEESVRDAVARHPDRFVGAFMFNPTAPEALDRLPGLLDDRTLRVIALFPAMHRYRVDDDRVARVFETASASGAVMFVHCGVLTVGVRKALKLPSPFDLRLGDPLAVAAVASRYPQVPVILPHFGAGFFREALMAVGQCANISLDTSSSNGWIKFHPGLTVDDVLRQALAVAGPERLLFGTDSSYFPRGWNAAVYEDQRGALERIGASADAQAQIFGGNYNRLFA